MIFDGDKFVYETSQPALYKTYNVFEKYEQKHGCCYYTSDVTHATRTCGAYCPI